MNSGKAAAALVAGVFSLLCQSCASVSADLAVTENAPKSDVVQQHVDRAFELAGDGFMRTTATLQCTENDLAMTILRGASEAVPMQVFDNLYYVGLSSVASWALQTSDGIILIDALNTTEDARNVIEPGMRQLGLDPASIKFIVVTQGHGDHYGGARYIVETYGARVLMSEPDWESAFNPPTARSPNGRPPPNWGKAPEKDMVVVDGQVLTLGDTIVRMVSTPGHSPGTISVLFPVYDDGEPHMAAMWGGMGFPRDFASLLQYVESADKFTSVSTEYGVDVMLSNHPFVDESLKRMNSLVENPDIDNPFVIGEEAAERYAKLVAECARAEVARREVADAE
jgi:metallo-beta-lactamase class B